VIVVLDAWAILAVLRAEPAARRVRRVIEEERPVVSAINLGEALYKTIRSAGESRALRLIDGFRSVVTTEEPDWQLVRDASRLKSAGGISYADCFAVATAQRHRAPVYTGDPEIIALGEIVDVIDLRSTA
jgi:predicted nucleic acid-binding protein